MGRQLPNFLEGWLEYTEPLPTPHLFRVWSGLGILSAAVSRRVWLAGHSRLPPCIPNLYIMLVGAPGVGKDVAINKAADLISAANDFAAPHRIARLGGESISKKGLIDKMADDRSKQVCTYRNGGASHTFDFHSLTFCIGELGTAMPEYDPALVPMLNEFYNNKASYDDTIRGLEVSVKNPHLVLLAGNQPDTLAEVFPDKAFRMGLTSRIIFVFAEAPVVRDIFDSEEQQWDKGLLDKLVRDFVDIARIGGPFAVETPVKERINEFNRSRPREVPTEKFKNYNTRRPLHAQKLAMLCAAAESNERIIRERHWYQALQLLYNVEAKMPAMFDEVVSSRGYSEVYEEVYSLGATATHHQLSMKLSRTRTPVEVPLIIRQLQADGVLIPELNDVGLPKVPASYRIVKL